MSLHQALSTSFSTVVLSNIPNATRGYITERKRREGKKRSDIAALSTQRGLPPSVVLNEKRKRWDLKHEVRVEDRCFS